MALRGLIFVRWSVLSALAHRRTVLGEDEVVQVLLFGLGGDGGRLGDGGDVGFVHSCYLHGFS